MDNALTETMTSIKQCFVINFDHHCKCAEVERCYISTL